VLDRVIKPVMLAMLAITTSSAFSEGRDLPHDETIAGTLRQARPLSSTAPTSSRGDNLSAARQGGFARGSSRGALEDSLGQWLEPDPITSVALLPRAASVRHVVESRAPRARAFEWLPRSEVSITMNISQVAELY
jgi:hypothetical protein